MAVRDRLGEFAANVFIPLPRSDQRAKAELYLRGLMLEGGRKSIQPMAERLGVDHQSLQQFVTSSTWDVAAVRARFAQRATSVVRPIAWAVGDVDFPKTGTGSPCVARQYAGTRRRVTNCQVGVSVHLVGEHASAAVNWRLFVPEDWDDGLAANVGEAAGIARRRDRCGIPDRERHRPKWRAALEMLDELIGWGLRPPVVVAGPGYGDEAEFRAALDRRRLPFLAQAGGKFAAGSFIRPAEVRRLVEGTHLELKDDLGLDHFEGRSWIGWNRHVTLASTAHLFRTSLRTSRALPRRVSA